MKCEKENMSRRNIRNITELKEISAECSCGCKMDIYNYGSQYYGQCSKCNTKTETYHSAFAVKNEQHKKLIRMKQAAGSFSG